jgi:hypothetical protein
MTADLLPVEAETTATRAVTAQLVAVLTGVALLAAALFAGAWLYRAAGGRDADDARRQEATARARRDATAATFEEVEDAAGAASIERRDARATRRRARGEAERSLAELQEALAAADLLVQSDEDQAALGKELFTYLRRGEAAAYNARVEVFNREYLDPTSPGVRKFEALQDAAIDYANTRPR